MPRNDGKMGAPGRAKTARVCTEVLRICAPARLSGRRFRRFSALCTAIASEFLHNWSLTSVFRSSNHDFRENVGRVPRATQ